MMNIDFIEQHGSELLSIVGAAAWLPIIFKPLVNHLINYFRKVQATVLDTRILTDGTSVSAINEQKKDGTILMLATNLFINNMTIFARNVTVKIKLKNGAYLNSEILDCSIITSNNNNGTKSFFTVPVENEFNISRTIHPNVDNIKYIAVLVESANFAKIDDISKIEIRLFYSRIKCKIFSKKITVVQSDFPTFNSTNMFNMVEKFAKDGEKI